MDNPTDNLPGEAPSDHGESLQHETSSQLDATNNGTGHVDPALLRVIHRKGYCILVAHWEDADAILRHDLPALNVPDIKLLTHDVVDPLQTLAIMQRPGVLGEQFGEAIHDRLRAIGWEGTATFRTLPEDCPDLITLVNRYAGEPHKFTGYLLELLADPQAQKIRRVAPPAAPPREHECPPLPDQARADEALAATASPWLDQYIAFSRKWAPRAFDEFHEACGVFILATTAARRIKIRFGRGVYTSLYLALAGRTTLYTKSTAADLAVEFLKRAGLECLLADDDATPQAFVRSLTAHVPENCNEWSAEARVALCQRLAFAAQKGWFYEEFGQHLEGMMRRDGPMAAFRGILRRLDDHKESYVYDTISRGREILMKPYLTILANVTPADLAPFAMRNSLLWRDGYLARIAFVTPPEGSRSDARFPDEAICYPPTLLDELREWHRRLGIPNVDLKPILDEKQKWTGRYRLDQAPLPEVTYTLAPEVKDAFYTYDNALRALTSREANADLDGSYGRFAMKALRIAGLLASLHDDAGTGVIGLAAWHRGQAIAERWRASLHRLMQQVQVAAALPQGEEVEQKILRALKKHGTLSAAELHAWTKVEIEALMRKLEHFVEARVVSVAQTKRTKKYALVERFHGTEGRASC
jgi:hypothetical protein